MVCLAHPTTSQQQYELLDHPVQKHFYYYVIDWYFNFQRQFIKINFVTKKQRSIPQNGKLHTFAKCFARAPVKITTPSRTKSYVSSSVAYEKAN